MAEGGNTRVQQVQRALNKDYLDYIGIQPCDGIFGPNTVDSLITALQACEGLPRREDVSSDDDMYMLMDILVIQLKSVYFYRLSDWEYCDTIIYFYEDNSILMAWPDTLMNSQMYDNWLTYTIYGLDSPKVMFNDLKNKQIPAVL